MNTFQYSVVILISTLSIGYLVWLIKFIRKRHDNVKETLTNNGEETTKNFFLKHFLAKRFWSIVVIASTILRVLVLFKYRDDVENKMQRSFIYLGNFFTYVSVLSSYLIYNLFYFNLKNDSESVFTLKNDKTLEDFIDTNLEQGFLILTSFGFVFNLFGVVFKERVNDDGITNIIDNNGNSIWKSKWTLFGSIFIIYSTIVKFVVNENYRIATYIGWGFLSLVSSIKFSEKIGQSSVFIYTIRITQNLLSLLVPLIAKNGSYIRKNNFSLLGYYLNTVLPIIEDINLLKK